MTGGLGNDVRASRTQGIETASFKLKSPGVQIDDNSSTEHRTNGDHVKLSISVGRVCGMAVIN